MGVPNQPPDKSKRLDAALTIPSVPLYGEQTRLAIANFDISGQRIPRAFLRALGTIKAAAAVVNRDLGLLEPAIAEAIEDAARNVAQGSYDDHFPVDVFQTGSGTSTNMNANEVIANLASRAAGVLVHPNDHVNMGQSSNDVIPSAIHLSAYEESRTRLLPALDLLADTIGSKARAFADVVKTGRTHLMDAVPLRMGQELSGWQGQITDSKARIEATLPRLARMALGGTAVGTGVNTHPEFGRRVAEQLAEATGLPLQSSPNFFTSISSQDTAVELSGQLKVCSVSLMKISNDLRWMNSGPVSGLSEIGLPALQAGSSIMPGKVNPVIPEAAAMACVRVMANDCAITIAGQSGNFQLNVMLPLIAVSLLESIQLLSGAAKALALKAIQGMKVNEERLKRLAQSNPILATMLGPAIGYDQAAEIVKQALREGRTIIEVARERTTLSREKLEQLLDPLGATRPPP
jgi:fumarate hydratase class II